MKNTGSVQKWSGNSANEIPFELPTDAQVKRMGRASHWVKIKHQGIIGRKSVLSLLFCCLPLHILPTICKVQFKSSAVM